MTRLLIYIFFITAGCASVNSAPHQSHYAGPAENAEALCKNGRFLQASYFLEAAIKTEEDERRYLPLLIETLIKSRRLLASLPNLQRLMELEPENTEVKELYRIILKITSSDIHRQTGENHDSIRNIQQIN